MDSSRLDQKLRITNQMEEEMLGDSEDDVFETERVNKSLP
jgi:hypothetical protein